MTQQDDITQRVLTDDEIMRSAISACDSLNITRFHEIGAPSKTIMDDAGLLELGRAIESTVLSQVRAPVAEQAALFAQSTTKDDKAALGILECGKPLCAPGDHHPLCRHGWAEKKGASAPTPKPWPVEEQPDGTVTPVDPVDQASAPVAGEAQPLGYVRKGREWPNQCYYPSSHKPTDIHNWTPVFDHAAPQASAENALMAPADVAQLVAFIFDRFGQPGDAGALPDNVAAAVRRLERGIKTQADKDGGSHG